MKKSVFLTGVLLASVFLFASCTPKDARSRNRAGNYHLVWTEEFEGDHLDENSWNYETHDPGWVNSELQSYGKFDDNIIVKDGELIIKAIKSVDENGKVSYTSGRITTMNKKFWKYGKIEARIKFASGKGLLPAFWMMPDDQAFYGWWPSCGEIDIAEVLGDQTDRVYGTLHYGNPHSQCGENYQLPQGQSFADSYHTFAIEWEPGEIRHYVDGIQYSTLNNWYSNRNGYADIAYPAPYDQSFFIILNLAVGGDWPGFPNPDDVFADNATMHVDWIKVWQKDSYDENVQKPVITYDFRKSDESGNFVLNPNFVHTEDLSWYSSNWNFFLAGGGDARAEISGSALNIYTENCGWLDYSVQAVQPRIPLNMGKKYKFSFDAWSDQPRRMIVAVTAPDYNYSRYLQDSLVTTIPAKQNYSFTFDVKERSDGNGRIEFNMGNQGSNAAVHITNVRLEELGDAETIAVEKTVLADGNYVYNGEFDKGSDRLACWTIDDQSNGAEVSVTNTSIYSRLFKISVPKTTSILESVALKQDDLALIPSTKYIFTFSARSDSEKKIAAKIAGYKFDVELGTELAEYKYEFNIGSEVSSRLLEFDLGVPGTIWLDDVCIKEDALLQNGEFSNGFAGYELYTVSPRNASAEVIQAESNSICAITVNDTGDQDWMIQLIKRGLVLEKGKRYRFSMKAMSSMNRKIMFAIQRNGSGDGNWTPYSLQHIVDVNGNLQTYSAEFTMDWDTDSNAMLSVSMGNVGWNEIKSLHTIYIDSLVLEEIK